MDWLLDTSAFYRASSEQSQARLRAAADGARLTTSCSTLLEILSGMTTENFEQRRRALLAVIRLCGREGILTPDTDVLVGRAFARKIQPFDIDTFWNGVRNTVHAPNFAAVAEGIPQRLTSGRFRVDFETLRAWDKSVGDGFKSEMDGQYRGVDPNLRALAQGVGVQGRDIAPFVRGLHGDIARTDTARRFALVGLAARAGLFPENSVRAAASDLKELERLCTLAEDEYDGSLDGYLRIYAEYHAACARLQRDPINVNDGLDFDPFVYLRLDDAEQSYVSAETLWLNVARDVIPGRVVDAGQITARPADAGHQAESR